MSLLTIAKFCSSIVLATSSSELPDEDVDNVAKLEEARKMIKMVVWGLL